MTKTKTKTDGERIAIKAFAGDYLNARTLAKAIDRAIRKRGIAAWDLGNVEGAGGRTLRDNPYRPKWKPSRRVQAILSMAASPNGGRPNQR